MGFEPTSPCGLPHFECCRLLVHCGEYSTLQAIWYPPKTASLLSLGTFVPNLSRNKKGVQTRPENCKKCPKMTIFLEVGEHLARQKRPSLSRKTDLARTLARQTVPFPRKASIFTLKKAPFLSNIHKKEQLKLGNLTRKHYMIEPR